jgi:hypothetical protein
MHATLDCLTAMAACVLHEAIGHCRRALAPQWSGQVGMVVLTELGVRRKVVSRTNRCSAGEEFMNVRLATAYVQEITG